MFIHSATENGCVRLKLPMPRFTPSSPVNRRPLPFLPGTILFFWLLDACFDSPARFGSLPSLYSSNGKWPICPGNVAFAGRSASHFSNASPASALTFANSATSAAACFSSAAIFCFTAASVISNVGVGIDGVK